MNGRASLRVVAYSHDSYGLGHIRRSLSVVAALLDHEPRAQALCVTGAPVADVFDVPPRCDVVKLPCISKAHDGGYRPRSLTMPFRELVALRAELITATVRTFRPDLVLVDHVTAGPGAELLPALRAIRSELRRTRIVVGLRDIIDAPHRVRARMAAEQTIDVLRELYDEIIVYGERTLFDVATGYSLPADLRDKTTYVGVACRPPRPASVAKSASQRPALLATAGGGGDGFALLRAFVDAFQGPLRCEPWTAKVVAGPLMSSAETANLRRAVRDDPRIRVLAWTRDMPRLLARADLVVGMGGYNSVYEALARGCRLLTLPRVQPRLEQRERCRRLESLGLLSVLPDAALDRPPLMAREIRRALAEPPPPAAAAPLRFDGAARAARHLLERLGASPALAHRAAGVSGPGATRFAEQHSLRMTSE